MASPEPEQPMAAAMQWVSRIFAAAILMVLPGLAGQWLDEKLGSRFLVLLGFGGGLVSGMLYLIGQTRQAELRRKQRQMNEGKDKQSDSSETA